MLLQIMQVLTEILQVLPQIRQVFRLSARFLPNRQYFLQVFHLSRLYTNQSRQYIRVIWHVATDWTTTRHSRHDPRIALTRITLGMPKDSAIYVLFKITGTGWNATVLLR